MSKLKLWPDDLSRGSSVVESASAEAVTESEILDTQCSVDKEVGPQ